MSVTYMMQMLGDHEQDSGVPCERCGKFFVDGGEDFSPFCSHCFVAETDCGVACPVCEETNIPRVFFDTDMQAELTRLKAARARQSLPA